MRTIASIAALALLAGCADSNVDNRQGSEHFVDGEFKNINPVQMHSFWGMLKEGLTSDVEQAVWPEWVDIRNEDLPPISLNNGDTRITLVNHATFLIQTDGLNILTDPVFSERVSPLSFIGPKRVHSPGIAIDNLPPIDVIAISHDHYDHLDLDSLKTIIKRDAPKVYAGLGVGARLGRGNTVTELDWGQQVEVNDDFTLWFLDVQHFSGRTLTDRNSTLWGGYLFEINNKKIYFGGDSGYADHYKRTFEQFGAVDIALLPIGAYAPRKFFKPIHMNPQEAIQAHLDLNAQLSIGMHYGTFQLSAEPREEPELLLNQARLDAGVEANAFVTLDVGQPLILSIGNGDHAETDSQAQLLSN